MARIPHRLNNLRLSQLWGEEWKILFPLPGWFQDGHRLFLRDYDFIRRQLCHVFNS
jgi:hypothetical protein